MNRRPELLNSDQVATIRTKPAPFRMDTTMTVGMGCDVKYDLGADGGTADRAGVATGKDIEAPGGPASRTSIRQVGSVAAPASACRQHGTAPTITRRLTRLGVLTDLRASTHG